MSALATDPPDGNAGRTTALRRRGHMARRCFSETANTAVYSDLFIDGAVVVGSTAALKLQEAQNASDGTSTTVLLNSTFNCVRVN